MIRKLLVIVLLLTTLILNAQSSITRPQFELCKEDFDVKAFSNDTTSSAIVIYEIGKSFIKDPSFDLLFKVKRKLKILNRDGFDKASVVINLYNDAKQKETVSNIKASTYNLMDGEIIHTILSEDNIIKEITSKNLTKYKFALPAVKEGSIITYSYEIRSPFLYDFKSWNFQSDIPKLHSEYHTSIPGNYQYYIKLNGSLKIDSINEKVNEKCVTGSAGTYADCFDAHYVMTDIPAFIDENFISSRKNYVSRLDYQLRSIQGFDGSLKLFKRIDERLQESKNFGGEMKRSNLVKSLIDKKSIYSKDELDRLKHIYEFVQSNYTWNGDDGLFRENSIKNLIENKSGSVCELNLLLHNLLIAYKIKSNPVILSTRDNGLIDKKRPKDSDFNYLIIRATINGKNYFLDASDKYVEFNQLPFKCLNQYGFLLDFENRSRWVPIEAQRTGLFQIDVELFMEENDDINGKVNINLEGHSGLEARKNYLNEQNSNYLSNYVFDMNTIDFSNRKVETINDTTFIYKESFDLNFQSELLGSNLYINPFILKSFKTNPFNLEERIYPVDYGFKKKYLYNIIIHLNDNYEVLTIPEEINFTLPENKGIAKLFCNQRDDIINISFSFDFKNAIYEPDDYLNLKEYIDSIINLQNKPSIILKRK